MTDGFSTDEVVRLIYEEQIRQREMLTEMGSTGCSLHSHTQQRITDLERKDEQRDRDVLVEARAEKREAWTERGISAAVAGAISGLMAYFGGPK